MIDIRTGKELTRREFGKGLAAILAAGCAPYAARAGFGLRHGIGLRTAVWSGKIPPPEDEDVFYVQYNGPVPDPDWGNPRVIVNRGFQYSIGDQSHWQTVPDEEYFGRTFYLTDADIGKKFYIKAVGQNDGYYNFGSFNEGYFALGGEIQWLVDENGDRNWCPERAFLSMFGDYNFSYWINGTVIDASELKLNAANPGETYYYQMFYGATLTHAPQIIADTLGPYCCYQMCSLEYPEDEDDESRALIHGAKVFIANELGESCCEEMYARRMFMTDPGGALQAITLGPLAFYYMFWDCTSLKEAPELQATTLADAWDCYSDMFVGCDLFDEVHMKAEVEGVYDPDIHGDTGKTVIYDL